MSDEPQQQQPIILTVDNRELARVVAAQIQRPSFKPTLRETDVAPVPVAPVPADEHDDEEKQQGGEMTAILWCLLAGVFVLAALFVYASCFPVFVR